MISLCKKAEIRYFDLHSIRLLACVSGKGKVTMIDIKTVLRHKNLSITERYTRRLTTVRAALKVLPGGKSPHLGNAAHILKMGNLA